MAAVDLTGDGVQDLLLGAPEQGEAPAYDVPGYLGMVLAESYQEVTTP